MLIIIILCGAFLVSFLLNKVYGRFWNQRLDAQVTFQREAVEEGQQAYLTEVIANRKWFFLPILQVGFQIHRNLWFADGENTSVSDQCYKRDIFSVGPYQKITRTIPFTCRKRGYFTLDRIELVTRSPLLTGKYFMTLSHPDAFYVFPAPVDGKRLDIPFQKIMGEVAAQKTLYEDPFEFCGIREYQPGDPMHRINWKASARSEGWMVNQYASTAAREVVILLDVDDETIWRYDDLHETGIRLAASLASRCIRTGIPVSIRTNGRDQLTGDAFSLSAGNGLPQMRALNEGLARIDLSKKALPMADVLTREKSFSGVSRTLIMISKNHVDDEIRLFDELLQQGASGLWIAPIYADMAWEKPQDVRFDMLVWEVER